MRRSNHCPGPSLDAWIKSPYGCGSGAGSPQPRSHLLGTWHPLCKFRKRNGDKWPIWGRTTKRTQGRRKDNGVDSGTRKGGPPALRGPCSLAHCRGANNESRPFVMIPALVELGGHLGTFRLLHQGLQRPLPYLTGHHSTKVPPIRLVVDHFHAHIKHGIGAARRR